MTSFKRAASGSSAHTISITNRICSTDIHNDTVRPVQCRNKLIKITSIFYVVSCGGVASASAQIQTQRAGGPTRRGQQNLSHSLRTPPPPLLQSIPLSQPQVHPIAISDIPIDSIAFSAIGTYFSLLDFVFWRYPVGNHLYSRKEKQNPPPSFPPLLLISFLQPSTQVISKSCPPPALIRHIHQLIVHSQWIPPWKSIRRGRPNLTTSPRLPTPGLYRHSMAGLRA